MVASWPGAVTVLPRISGQALGLVIVAFGIALAPASERPDVLIEREGATAALRSKSGNLVFPPATAASYSVDNWLLDWFAELGAHRRTRWRAVHILAELCRSRIAGLCLSAPWDNPVHSRRQAPCGQ